MLAQGWANPEPLRGGRIVVITRHKRSYV
ncbi:protein of unknown function [Cupriavidus neocaledonicus]|uniref:Uncharacterized protein n=1 Tax=Cupriavidus neocaledonicus TaxID=1040979 RepID=A0A375H3Y7_9BURK|nr:protein of unknown function [Cupriavidus neocaledonicus]